MPQVLVRGTTKFEVDDTFRDDGQPPVYGTQGGQRILLNEGTPPRPEVHRKGAAFFTADFKPVTDPVQVEHLPEPYRRQALKFIQKSGGKAKLPPKDDPRRVRDPRVSHREVVLDGGQVLGTRTRPASQTAPDPEEM